MSSENSGVEERSYLSVSGGLSKDFRISIREIISSEPNNVNQAEVDMVKEEVKRWVAKRNNFQNIPGKVRKEVGRYSLVNETKAAGTGNNLTEIGVKAYICK